MGVKKQEAKKICERYLAGELKFPLKFEDFNCPSPGRMPRHFFPGVKKLDYDSAIKAEISRLKVSAFSVMPRCWYIDAWFECPKCGNEYCWEAKTQQIWFEEYDIWCEAYPKLCPECRQKCKKLARLKSEYAEIAAIAILRTTEPAIKEHILRLIGEIEELSEEPLSRGIIEKRQILQRQLNMAEQKREFFKN